MKFSKLFLAFSCAALAVGSAAADKVVFEENFDSADALKKWRIVEYPGSSKFRIDKGALSVEHQHKPGYGSFIEIEVPKVKKGRLDFDVMIDPDRINPGARIGLTLDLYNIATFWHDSCRDWRMYFAEPNIKRLPYFMIEPVGHRKIANVAKHKYIHYTILFDEEGDMVEFYAGDPRDPKASRYDVSVFGNAMYRGGYLRIGSYAYTTVPYRTLVDNIVLRELAGADAQQEKTEYLLFDGLGSDHYPLARMLKKQGVRRYIYNSPGASVSNRNNLQYFGMPGMTSVENAKLIIFNDSPNVDPVLQKKMLQSVKDGSDLLILSGLFSLGKGGFRNSVLEQALPVILTDDIWTVAGSPEKPLQLKTNVDLNWNANGAVLYYYWDLKLAEGSEILMTASESGWFGKKNIPVLSRKKYGKGYIYVLNGTACGPSEKNSFWNTEFLAGLLKYIEAQRQVSAK